MSSVSSASASSWIQDDADESKECADDQGSASLSTTTEEYEELECNGHLDDGAARELLLPTASTSVSSTTIGAESGSKEKNGVFYPNESVDSNGEAVCKLTNPPIVEEAPQWPSGLGKNTHMDVDRSLFRRLLHIGPIFAIMIVLIIGFTTSILHVTWWPITSPLGCADLLIFLTWNYLVLFNLLKAAFVGGGYVTLGWHPVNEAHNNRLQYCHRCCGFKVPRSHHCSKCNRCVMKMDHHCPWINNCVGHRNQVYFMRFLFFAVVGCAHGATILTICIWRTLSMIYWGDPYRQPFHAHKFIIDSIYSFLAAVLAVSFSLGVIIAVGFLLFIQLRSAWRNKTGIEQYICMKAEYRERDEPEFVYPYDLGWKRNLKEVYNGGSGFAKGNGVWWPIVSGCDQFTLTEEQLEQKRIKQEYARTHQNRELPNTCWARFSRRFLQPIYNFFM